MVLCVPCDRQFSTRHALEQHLQSSKHRCELCNKFFKFAHSKVQHAQSLSNHHWTQRGSVDKIHPQTSPRDSGKKEKQTPILGTTILNSTPHYIGIPRTIVMPVFKMACRLRSWNLDSDILLKHIDTPLDHMVVSALIEAALRLLTDNTPEGKLEAKARMQQKTKQALLYETSFIDHVRRVGFQLLTEDEQKQSRLRSTPDIRFVEPVSIHGHICHWIEYKSYFGFKANPFIASKETKQFKKYVADLGSGAVVYKLGFEVDHIQEPGICLFREAEFLHVLGRGMHAPVDP